MPLILFTHWYILILIFISVTSKALCQTTVSDHIKTYTFTLNADAGDWMLSGIQVHKGDFVIFESGSRYNLGQFTKNVDATGAANPFIQVYNRIPDYYNGALLCKNSTEILGAQRGRILKLKTDISRFVGINHIQIPVAVSKYFDRNNFTGNYFISTDSSELAFVLNDKKINDNDGVLSINVIVFSMLPPLDKNYDFAKYVDNNNGVVPFCFKDDCVTAFGQHEYFSGGLWFSGTDMNGHSYLAINPVGTFNGDLINAFEILSDNIYNIFPRGAVDILNQNTPEQTTIQLGHTYKLLYKFFNPVHNSLPPSVDAIDVSKFHFTFKAKGWHPLYGTAIHGLFTDKCGDLYMFQQGKGMSDEIWNTQWTGIQYPISITGYANRPLAMFMWRNMANNMTNYVK